MTKKTVFIAIACFGLLFGGCAVNPITGEEELMIFPREQDIAIGQKYAPELERQLGGRIENESIQNYVDAVGQRVAKVSHWKELEYHFTVVNDESVNAVTLPGGYIFITKGMLKKLDSEAQLAAILGHEVSHVVTRDTINAMSNQIGIDILLSAAVSDGASGAAQNTIGLGRRILSLSYSREDERTADMGGIQYTYKAGYNPYGMVETMKILEEQSEARPIEFLSSHPNPGNRAEYITARIKSTYFNLTGLETGEQDYRRIVLGQLR